jgi:hypothetical protein
MDKKKVFSRIFKMPNKYRRKMKFKNHLKNIAMMVKLIQVKITDGS